MCQIDTVTKWPFLAFVAYVEIYAFFGGTKWTQNLRAGDQIRFWGLGRQTWWLSTIYQTKYWSHSIILVDLELLAHTWRDGDLLYRDTKLSPQLHEPFWGLINYEANLLSEYLQVGHWPVVVNCSDRDQVLKGSLLRGRPFQINFARYSHSPYHSDYLS